MQDTKKMNVGTVRIPMILVLLVMIVPLMTGCGLQKKVDGTGTIQTFVTNLFTDISESEYKEFKDAGDTGTDLLTDSSELPGWIETRFKENMAEEGYEVFVETAAYYIPVLSYENNKAMKLENLEIKETEEDYDICGVLTVSDKDDASKSVEITLKGSAQVDEEGRISYINIFNIDEAVSEILQ